MRGAISFLLTNIYFLLCCSVAKLCLSLCDPMDCSSPGSFVLYYLPDFAQIHVCWVSDAIQPSHSPSPLLLPLIFPSIRVFFNESVLCIRWPKYWSFSISPFNEYSGLISFRIDWFDLLAVQGALKNLIQHHSSKASILQCSALFVVQFSHWHVTTEKNILWLCGSLLANWCLCFLIYCLVFSWHFFQGAGIF